jgi:hypothetical protein
MRTFERWASLTTIVQRLEASYVVLAGSGRLKLGDEIRELESIDAIRVAPRRYARSEAGPDGIEVLAFGPRHDGDGEMIQGWWSD